jgi:acetolactate synthase-1/2/3 large subunit
MSENPASAASRPTRLTGAENVWATLEGEGVREVFGYPGGAILPVYDALRKYPIRHILVRHEQCAAHAADGYARASGKVGVAIATSGPAATNLVTGIATAMMDSVPMVCITGQVSSKLLGSDAFQEVDITGDYAADHQAQLQRDTHGGNSPGSAQSLPRCPFRSPRPSTCGHH